MIHSLTRRAALLALSAAAFAQSSASDLERVKVGTAPPDFELPAAGGKKVSLASLKGKNLVLVFYRGYW